MNTLGKKITSRFFEEQDGFAKMQAAWRANWQDKEFRDQLEPVHHFLYAALRGKDWRKGFEPIKNEVKLTNGQRAFGAATRSIELIRQGKEDLLKPFGGAVKLESLSLLMTCLPYDQVAETSVAYLDRAASLEEAA